jgi:hypothetical protein
VIVLATVTSASCEFGETVIPDGDPIVVVHAVLRPDLDTQWILVEQTLTGAGADSTGGSIPGNPPQVPITEALVTVVNRSFTQDPCGVTQFTEAPLDLELVRSAGLYWGPLGCPTMRAGDTLELRVETLDGHAVSGRSEVPGAQATVLRVGGDSVLLPGPTLLFNRDVDTLEAEVRPIAGRAIQVEVHRSDSLGQPVPVTRLFVDSTLMTLPGNLTDFLSVVIGEEDSTESEDAPPIFRAGRYHSVTVALTDDRYFDFSRSGNIPISGRGFVNHLEGGMGVFGAVVAESNMLKVVGDLDDEREGTYNMQGTVEGMSVDVDLELYVAATDRDSSAAAAFVVGQWVLGGLDASSDGTVTGDRFAVTIYQIEPSDSSTPSAHLITGALRSGQPFAVDVYNRNLTLVGQLTGTKTSGLLAEEPRTGR